MEQINQKYEMNLNLKDQILNQLYFKYVIYIFKYLRNEMNEKKKKLEDYIKLNRNYHVIL